MKWLTLTEPKGKKIDVNFDHVARFEEAIVTVAEDGTTKEMRGMTMLVFSGPPDVGYQEYGKTVAVLHRPEQIRAALKTPEDYVDVPSYDALSQEPAPFTPASTARNTKIALTP